MEKKEQNIFRQKTIRRITSPEHLTDYLRVTGPGVWAVLIAVILLLAGVLAWSVVGTLETRAEVRVVVSGHVAQVIPTEAETLAEGMPLCVSGQEYRIASAGTDEYGRSMGVTEVDLPDGTYNGEVVTETVHPIRFLLEGR